MADDKLQRLHNLMNAAKGMIESLLDADELFDSDGDLFLSSATLIIALHEMGCPVYDLDNELVEEAYNIAERYNWFDGSGFPADNPFEEKSQ